MHGCAKHTDGIQMSVTVLSIKNKWEESKGRESTLLIPATRLKIPDLARQLDVIVQIHLASRWTIQGPLRTFWMVLFVLKNNGSQSRGLPGFYGVTYVGTGELVITESGTKNSSEGFSWRKRRFSVFSRLASVTGSAGGPSFLQSIWLDRWSSNHLIIYQGCPINRIFIVVAITRAINSSRKTAWHAMNKKNNFVYMRHACTLSMLTFSLSGRALDKRANRMKPQLAVSFPDKINRHQFGGDCQVIMAEGGERSDENVVDEDLVVKRNSTECVMIVWVCMYVTRKQ